MNKTAIKNFAIWARNKLIAEITYKAGLLGITEKEIKSPLPQSSKDVQFFDIGTREPYSITGVEIEQRAKLAEAIQQKEEQSDYKTAFKNVIEEVAYTWFNRLIAVRFMEVNDFLPSRIRVLSSESSTKMEPDLVTTPFDADLEYTPYEKDRIMQLKHDNKLDELFRMLFIKQCNALNAILPELFEKTNDYTELLLNVSFTDKDGVVYHLVHDIHEDDFNIEKEGQVEIIGWLYQYYNTEPKDEAFALLKKNIKITKERIPAVTQLFTPDWIVRYMVENSLGRLWIEGHPNDGLKAGWKYYLDESEQEPKVRVQLEDIREEYKAIKPEDIKVIDPCMGSGHILVYAFDVLMQIYESCGYSQRDAAKSILVHNIYGLDLDKRAYQLAYFALMMKARQYNRRILDGQTDCHLYSIQESNGINRDYLKYFGEGMCAIEKNKGVLQLQGLLDTFIDAKEYGSIINVENYNWELLYRFVGNVNMSGQLSLDMMGFEDIKEQLRSLVEIGATMTQKYDVVLTNPPYMGISNGNGKLNDYVKKNFEDSKPDLFAVFIERCCEMTKKNRYTAMLTQHAWMFLSSFEKLREKIQSVDTVNMVHLGPRAFDEIGGEVVQTTSFVLKKHKTMKYKGTYVRLVDFKSQSEKEKAFFQLGNRYSVATNNFIKIPGKPIAYWVSTKLLSVFEKGTLLKKYTKATSGQNTGDNARFLKLWYEVSYNKIKFDAQPGYDGVNCKWIPCLKGGSYRRWYGNLEYVIDWENDGAEMKAFATIRNNGKHWSRYIQSLDCFYCEGISWSKVSSGRFSMRHLPKGFICETAGCAVFGLNKDLYTTLAYFNTPIVQVILEITNPTMNFQPGNIGSVPVLGIENEESKINELSIESVNLTKIDWDSFETSWDFIKHPLIRATSTIALGFDQWTEFTETQFNKLKTNEEELNRFFIYIYGLQDELTPEVDDKNVTIRKAELGRDIRSFISYAVGCMFGRYSLDVDGLIYAGGEWDDSKYSTFIPDKDNIIPITDEEYFEDDVVGLFCAFLTKTFGVESLEENLDFIAKALGNKGNSSREIIRNYLLKDFFKDHCKVYQKRPIYWLFDSGKADGFKVLIYMHRYNADTIGNLRIDYLHRMQRIYDSEITRMQETIDNSSNAREVAAAIKRKEKLRKQLKETKEYDEKIAHLALARISIDLDDGVKVNYEKVQTGTDGKKLEVLAKI